MRQLLLLYLCGALAACLDAANTDQPNDDVHDGKGDDPSASTRIGACAPAPSTFGTPTIQIAPGQAIASGTWSGYVRFAPDPGRLRAARIGSGTKVVIAPGTRVEFADASQLVVEGGLLEANGTCAEPIVIGGEAPGARYQIVANDAGHVRLHQVVLENGDSGVVVAHSPLRGLLVADEVTVRGFTKAGIEVAGANAWIHRSRIGPNAGWGLVVAGSSAGHAFVTHSEIVNNATGGVRLAGTGTSARSTVRLHRSLVATQPTPLVEENTTGIVATESIVQATGPTTAQIDQIALPPRPATTRGDAYVRVPGGAYNGRDLAVARYEIGVLGRSPEQHPSLGTPLAGFFDVLAYANQRSVEEQLTACYQLVGCTTTASGGLDRCERARWNPACDGYRLPTAVEWERLARSGVRAPAQRPTGLLTAIAAPWGSSDGCYLSCTGDDPALRELVSAEAANGNTHLGEGGLTPNLFGMCGTLSAWPELTWTDYYAQQSTRFEVSYTSYGIVSRENKYAVARGGCTGIPSTCRIANTLAVMRTAIGTTGPQVGVRLVRSIPVNM